MGRYPRISYPGATYHIIVRGNNGRIIFPKPGDYKKFLFLLKEYSIEMFVKIFDYSLIPNHLHLFLCTLRANISNFMQRLLTMYVRGFKKQYNHKGHLLQGRFRSILVPDEGYVIKLFPYIDLNAKKAGLVIKPEDYKWCALQELLGISEFDIISKDEFLNYFGDVQSYLKFLHENDSYEDLVPKKYKGFEYYGDLSFAKKSLEIFNRRKKKGIGIRRKEDIEKIVNMSGSEILLFFKKNYSFDHNKIVKPNNKFERLLRKRLIYILKRFCCLSNLDVAKLLNIKMDLIVNTYYRYKEFLKVNSAELSEINKIYNMIKMIK